MTEPAPTIPLPVARKNWWRLKSTQLSAIGGVLQAIFMAWVSIPLELWNVMPAELKAFLPPRAMFLLPLIFFVAATVARFVPQRRLAEKLEQSE